jgi:hypothetical protein
MNEQHRVPLLSRLWQDKHCEIGVVKAPSGPKATILAASKGAQTTVNGKLGNRSPTGRVIRVGTALEN